MGWSDRFARCYPFAAFVAEVFYNVFHGGKRQSEYSSYGYGDHPRQFQHSRSPKNNNRYYSSKEKRRDEKRMSRCHVDDSKTAREDWDMKSHRVSQRRKTYEEKGVLRRMYKDSKGKEVVEQKQYRVKKYEEDPLSPELTESRGRRSWFR